MEIAVGHQPRALDEPVGERRLAVIDMGDDAEIADSLGFQLHRSWRQHVTTPRALSKAQYIQSVAFHQSRYNVMSRRRAAAPTSSA